MRWRLSSTLADVDANCLLFCWILRNPCFLLACFSAPKSHLMSCLHNITQKSSWSSYRGFVLARLWSRVHDKQCVERTIFLNLLDTICGGEFTAVIYKSWIFDETPVRWPRNGILVVHMRCCYLGNQWRMLTRNISSDHTGKSCVCLDEFGDSIYIEDQILRASFVPSTNETDK